MKLRAGIYLLLTLTAVTVVAQSPGSGPDTKTITVPAGTVLHLKFIEPVSPSHAQQGAPVTLEAREPVVVDGVTVIRVGTRFDGSVAPVETMIQQKTREALVLQLNHIVFSDDYVIDLTGTNGTHPTAIARVGHARSEHPMRKPFIRAAIIVGVGTGIGAALGYVTTGVAAGIGAAAASFTPVFDKHDYSLYVVRHQPIDVVLNQPLEIDVSRIPASR